ncbi:GNAT family N-acetyltransferase [Aquibacillus rhizosphaerae]|uniref:GNAT family N-acetyltransferase n=1 Tax=Aquibacillus rhizosphaerae TaxID=3051431 RepID=A0ABT7L7C4_9BACI|nr:GNAT family N-acetyltransferase [Aquibacillus sp. LR5S19]MDL4841294.1 GNAT family N-acetyltransferase [Aquibacillus sp. LR5S19]
MDALKSLRLILEPIDLTTASNLLNETGKYSNPLYIHNENEFPSNALRAFLPIYIELLENDMTMLGYGPWILRNKTNRMIIGEIGLRMESQDTIVLDIGYQIISEFRNQGFATEAVSVICDWAFTKGVRELNAYCDLENKASQKVLIKNNFVIVSVKTDLIFFKKTCSNLNP